MKRHITKTSYGTCHWHEHSPEELEAAWNDTQGQGNSYARARNWCCVIVPCNKKQALDLSAIFHKNFAIESCCHWNGEDLSMYCGDAGSGADSLRLRMEQVVRKMGFKPTVV